MLVRRAVVAAARQAPVISRALAVVPCRRLPRAAALGSPHAAMAQRVARLCVATPLGARRLSLSAAQLDKKMGEVNDLFVEARELIADALDSQGSTYFEDDLDDAQHAVKECIDEYNAMLSQLDDGKKAEVMRSMGMKMEQLKGELALILDSLLHDEELPSSGRKDDV